MMVAWFGGIAVGNKTLLRRFSVLVDACTGVRTPVLLDCLISLVISLMSFVPTILIKYLIDTAIPKGNGPAILYVSMLMVLCPVLIRVFGIAAIWSQMKAEHKISTDLRAKVFSAYLMAPLDEASRLSSGQVLTVMNSDVPALTTGLLSLIHGLCNSAFSLVVAGVLLWRTSPLICLGVLLASVVRYPLVSSRVRVLRKMTRTRQNWQARISRMITDVVGAFVTIKVHSLENRNVDLLTTAVEEEHRDRLAFQRRIDRHGVGETAVGWLVPSIVYAYGGFLTMAGRTTIGAVVAATQYMGRGIESLSTLIDIAGQSKVLSVHYDNVQGLMALPQESDDDTVDDLGVLRTIEIRDGGYTFCDDEEPLLRHIDLFLSVGHIVGLFGPSGSGKTTLATVLGGLRRLASGHLVVNGTQIACPARSYRKRVALATDGECVFSGTFKDNLLAVRPDASEVELSRSLYLSLLDEVVSNSPSGMDTTIGQGGLILSTGQRQRLSLARAILRNPDLIILDEITSGFDLQLEEQLFARLETWLRERLVILISHRPSTLRFADTWLYLNEIGCLATTACPFSQDEAIESQDARSMASHSSI